MLAGVVSLLTQGLNYGIEFKGGTSWEVHAPHVSVAKARDALRPLGLADAKIQTVDRTLFYDRKDHNDQDATVFQALVNYNTTDKYTWARLSFKEQFVGIEGIAQFDYRF